MAREGYWTWPGGGRYEGVPAIELRRLVRHRAGGVRRVRGARARRGRRRRGAGALRLDLGRRGVRQRWCCGGGRAWRRRAARRWAPSRCRRCRGGLRAMKVVVVGAGVGGLAAAIGLAAAGHARHRVRAGAAPGRQVRAGRARRRSPGTPGPSLLTMPWVVRATAGGQLELLRVEPVTRYGSPTAPRSSSPPTCRARSAALEAWSPGAGADWTRFLGTCAAMWRASERFLTGPPPWPPRAVRAGRPARRAARQALVDAARSSPAPTRATRGCGWSSSASRPTPAPTRGARPPRWPSPGYVEHAFGAWHPRGGLYELVLALVAPARGARRRAAAAASASSGSGRRRPGPRRGDRQRARSRPTPSSPTSTRPPSRACSGAARTARERSLSGLAAAARPRGRTPDLAHHRIDFPADYDAEFDDVFVHRRPVRDPTVYVSAPAGDRAGAGGVVRAGQRAGAAPADWGGGGSC